MLLRSSWPSASLALLVLVLALALSVRADADASAVADADPDPNWFTKYFFGDDDEEEEVEVEDPNLVKYRELAHKVRRDLREAKVDLFTKRTFNMGVLEVGKYQQTVRNLYRKCAWLQNYLAQRPPSSGSEVAPLSPYCSALLVDHPDGEPKDCNVLCREEGQKGTNAARIALFFIAGFSIKRFLELYYGVGDGRELGNLLLAEPAKRKEEEQESSLVNEYLRACTNKTALSPFKSPYFFRS